MPSSEVIAHAQSWPRKGRCGRHSRSRRRETRTFLPGAVCFGLRALSLSSVLKISFGQKRKPLSALKSRVVHRTFFFLSTASNLLPRFISVYAPPSYRRLFSLPKSFSFWSPSSSAVCRLTHLLTIWPLAIYTPPFCCRRVSGSLTLFTLILGC
jgi:hypothetical protein